MDNGQAFLVAWMDPHTLADNPKNWRLHPERQREAVAASLSEHGWLLPVLWNRRTGNLVDGHERVAQARKEGSLVPVHVLDVSPEQELRILAVLDPTTEMAERDHKKLHDLLVELRATEAGLPKGWDDQEIRALEKEIEARERKLRERAGVSDELPPNPPSRCQTGEKWRLGPHTLFVGDCTNTKDIGLLLGDCRPRLCFTSPPYGVGANTVYGPNMPQRGRNRNEKYAADSNQDAFDEDAYHALLTGFLVHSLSRCRAVCLNVQMLARNKRPLLTLLDDFGEQFCDAIIWDKGCGQPAMAENTLNREFEFLFFFAPMKEATVAVPGSNFTRGTLGNVYHGPPQRNNPFADTHGAVMPVHLAEFVLNNFTRRLETVYDPFAGTGTTLVVSEALGRVCFCMEKVPAYGDILLKRWEDMTGQRAERMD